MQTPDDVQRLIAAYQEAQQQLIKIISEKAARGNVTVYQKELLRQVMQMLTELDKEAYKWCNDVIPEYYKQGADEAVAGLEKLNQEIDDEKTSHFTQLHKEAILQLVRNTYLKLNSANGFVGRQIRDAVRKAGLDAVTQKIATGQTVKECKKNLMQALIDKGINGIKDKRGRNISLSAYAETVARSTTREATNTATTQQLTDLGYDLVQMSSHLTSCPLCVCYQGRVYSISGKSSEYPPLDAAYSGDYANIHPNCRHVLTPYIPKLDDNAEQLREFSNRSFDVDKVSKKEIDIYNGIQKHETQLRNDREQYQRYKLAFGKDAPKSFAGFRRMKNSNSGKYQELESEYRSLRMGGK